MPIVKKLIFAPFFLIFFGLLIYQINPLLNSYDFLFAFSLNSFLLLLFLSALIALTGFLFVLFASLSLDWKVVLPVGVLASFLPIFFLPLPLGLVFVSAVLVSLLLGFITLENAMKTYLTFHPAALLGPSIRYLCSFLILAISITYFLSINKMIQEKGFQIPDALIDAALQINAPKSTETSELVKQSGLGDLTNNFIKQTLKEQTENLLKPFLGFIPAFMTIVLFFTLQSLTSIISLLIYPLLWLTFLIFEKIGYVKFTTETREIKKMVI